MFLSTYKNREIFFLDFSTLPLKKKLFKFLWVVFFLQKDLEYIFGQILIESAYVWIE